MRTSRNAWLFAAILLTAACGGASDADPAPDGGDADATADAIADADTNADADADADADATADATADADAPADADATADAVDVPAPDALQLIAPNGGETWLVGQAAEILWAGGDTTTVVIELSVDGGETFDTVLSDGTDNDGAHSITVGAWPTRGAYVRIRTIDDAETDRSDARFEIPATLGILRDWNEALRTACDGVGEDLDGDGLYSSTDPDTCPGVEEWLGTDTEHRDSDRDAVSDYFEVFGDDIFAPNEQVPDEDGDGVIAALDVDDDGDSEHDGLGLDSDRDGVANFLEVYGYEYDALADRLFRWDGDVTARYFKSDPLQPSTDQDPYPDGMEVTGVFMDPSVRAPGDHPMIPGYPNIIVTLEAYDVSLEAEITYTDGITETAGQEWTRSVDTEASVTEELSWELGTEVGGSVGVVDSSVSATVSGTIGGRRSATYTTAVGYSSGESRASAEQWSEAVSSNPSETARISLHLKVRNVGTSTASNIRPTFTLRIGTHNVTTFTPGGPLVEILEPGGVYPASTATTWVVDRRTEGELDGPIFLTLDELRALEAGAPVVLEVTQLEADVYRQTDDGTWADIGTWNQYMARIEAVAAHVVLDGGDGRVHDAMIYADDAPTAPVVTLRDALIWVAGAYDDPELGTAVRFEDTVGALEAQSLDSWFFNFDGETYERLAVLREDPDFNLLDLQLGPDSVVVAKAPPAEPQPQIAWVAPLFYRDEVIAWAHDFFFAPDEIEVELHDTTGEGVVVYAMAYDTDRGVFVAEVPGTYVVDATDFVRATNPFHAVAERPEQWRSEMPVPGYVDAYSFGTVGQPETFTNAGCSGTSSGFRAYSFVRGLSSACSAADPQSIVWSDSYECPHCGVSGSLRSPLGIGEGICSVTADEPWDRMRLTDARRCVDWRVDFVTSGGETNLARMNRADLLGERGFVWLLDEAGNVRFAKFRIVDVTGSDGALRNPVLEYVVWDEIEAGPP